MEHPQHEPSDRQEDDMNVARTKPRRTRSSGAPAPDRIPEKRAGGPTLSVAEIAYQLFEKRGKQHGHQLEDWLEAERRVSDRISDKQAADEEVHV
jgi:hypothetical protein